MSPNPNPNPNPADSDCPFDSVDSAYLLPVAARPLDSEGFPRPMAELGSWGVEPKNNTGLRSNRDMLGSAGCSAARQKDPSGDARGAFLGALSSCAMNASSTAEALPFVQSLARETGEPGWLLADEALAADSAPFLEALIELGLLDPAELVWSGTRNQAGERLCERTSPEEAIHRGATRCLAALRSRVSPQGLLSAAADRQDRSAFEMILPLSAQPDLDHALGKACFFGYRLSRESGRMGASEMIQTLVSAGARMSAPCIIPRGRLHTLPMGFGKGDFSGAKLAAHDVDDSSLVWAPALRLAEPSEAMPAGCSREGWIQAPAFLSAITCAGALALWAVDASQPAADAWEALSSPSLAGWELPAPGAMISPLGLMAMSSGEARLARDGGEARDRAAQIISASPLLAVECAQGQPLAAARSIIGRWLWGDASLVGPSMTWFSPVQPDPLVKALAGACSAQGWVPLGPVAAREASQQFIGRMRFMSQIPPYVFSNSARTQEAFEEAAASEAAMAAMLGSLMPEPQRILLISAVESCRARGPIQNNAERARFAESIILSLSSGPAPSSCRRPRSL